MARFFDMIGSDQSEETWERMSIINKYEKINVPAFHIAGWYDNLLQPTLRNYTELNRQGHSQQKIIIGPWAHGIFHSIIGERNFGIHSSGESINLKEDLTSLHIQWFNKWLKEEDTRVENEAPIKLFVMGINEWRDEYEWPLARTEVYSVLFT